MHLDFRIYFKLSINGSICDIRIKWDTIGIVLRVLGYSFKNSSTLKSVDLK